jgi:hypothetical protein
MILSEREITREIILSGDRYINTCALDIPADQIGNGGMENNNLGLHFGDAQTVAQPGRYNSNREVYYAISNMDNYGTCPRFLYEWMRNAQFLNA